MDNTAWLWSVSVIIMEYIIPAKISAWKLGLWIRICFLSKSERNQAKQIWKSREEAGKSQFILNCGGSLVIFFPLFWVVSSNYFNYFSSSFFLYFCSFRGKGKGRDYLYASSLLISSTINTEKKLLISIFLIWLRALCQMMPNIDFEHSRK